MHSRAAYATHGLSCMVAIMPNKPVVNISRLSSQALITASHMSQQDGCIPVLTYRVHDNNNGGRQSYTLRMDDMPTSVR